MSGGGSAGRRLSAITLDQAIAGGSNVLAGVLAARVLGVESFGLFGIVFLAHVTAVGCARALVSQPLLVHPDQVGARTGEAMGSGLRVGVLAAAPVVVGGLVALGYDDRLAWALLVLAACLPLIVLQDLGRYLGFATHRPALALVLDSVWLGLLVVTAAALVLLDLRTLPAFVAAWAGSGAAAGLLVPVQQRAHRVSASAAWLRSTWGLSWRYLVSFAVTQGAALVATVALGAIAGARALAGVRGAALVLSPFTTFVIAGSASGVTDIARERDPREVRRRAVQVTGVAAVVAVVNGLALVALPDALGRLVLGASWEAVQPLAVVAAVDALLTAVALGPRVALQGLRRAGTSLGVDLWTTPVLVGAAVVGALVDGALGYFWAVAIVHGLAALVWWGVFLGTQQGAEPVSTHGGATP